MKKNTRQKLKHMKTLLYIFAIFLYFSDSGHFFYKTLDLSNISNPVSIHVKTSISIDYYLFIYYLLN